MYLLIKFLFIFLYNIKLYYTAHYRIFAAVLHVIIIIMCNIISLRRYVYTYCRFSNYIFLFFVSLVNSYRLIRGVLVCITIRTHDF